jgi:iron(III) transport system permease protein
MLIFFLSRWFVSRGSYVMMSKGGVSGIVPQATRRETVLIYAAVLTLTFLAIVPHLGVVLMSLADRWGLTILPERYTLNSYKLVFEEPIAYSSIFNSIEFSLLSTLLDVVLGVAIAYLIIRKPSRLSPLLDGLAMLPLALPGLVLAFGYLTCYNKVSLFGWNLGEYLNPVNNAVPLLVIAYTVRRLPFVTRSAGRRWRDCNRVPPCSKRPRRTWGRRDGGCCGRSRSRS